MVLPEGFPELPGKPLAFARHGAIVAMVAMAGGWSDSKLPEAQSPGSVPWTPSVNAEPVWVWVAGERVLGEKKKKQQRNVDIPSGK